MSSILTNNSAMVALQTLKSINSNLAKTQNEVATGKSISSAKDNAAIWAISKVMETDQSAFKAIQSNLNTATAVVSTGLAGAEQITTLLQEMKDLATGVASDGNEYSKVNADIQAKKDQISAVINASQLNGVNLLRTNPVPGQTDYTVLASLDRTMGTVETDKVAITVESIDFEADIQAVDITDCWRGDIGDGQQADFGSVELRVQADGCADQRYRRPGGRGYGGCICAFAGTADPATARHPGAVHRESSPRSNSVAVPRLITVKGRLLRPFAFLPS